MADPNQTTTAPTNANPRPLTMTKEKAKAKRKHWQPPAPNLPATAEHLLQMPLPEMNRLATAAELRHGWLKGRRAWVGAQIESRIRSGDQLDELARLRQKQAQILAELAELGRVLSAVKARRTELRVAMRRELGQPVSRAEAIALAVDRIAGAGLHAVIAQQADRIQEQSIRDLSQEAQP